MASMIVVCMHTVRGNLIMQDWIEPNPLPGSVAGAFAVAAMLNSTQMAR